MLNKTVIDIDKRDWKSEILDFWDLCYDNDITVREMTHLIQTEFFLLRLMICDVFKEKIQDTTSDSYSKRG